jgi:hypothetical protein
MQFDYKKTEGPKTFEIFIGRIKHFMETGTLTFEGEPPSE